MRGKAIWCAVLLAACQPHVQAADTKPAGAPACDPHSVTDIALLADLPPAVQGALEKRGAMAEKGGKFNSTDVISLKDPTPRTRFARAGQWRNFVLVWYEAGGIALFHRVAVFRLDPGGTVKALSDQLDSGQDFCALTNGKPDAGKPAR